MNPHEIGPAQGFWALLTAEEQAVLADLGRIRVFAPGAMICDEGEPATHVFVLLDGLAKVVSSTADGHEQTLALRGDGDLVGEIAGQLLIGEQSARHKRANGIDLCATDSHGTPFPVRRWAVLRPISPPAGESAAPASVRSARRSSPCAAKKARA